MKLSFTALMVATLACGVAAAQTPQTGEKVTMAGCLQRAQRNGSVGGTAVGTSASPSTADDEANSGAMVDAYLLSEATPVTDGAPAPAVSTSPSDRSTTGATGTSGRSEITSFALVGREAELERHQGARLQVTGTLMPAAHSGRGTGGAATESGVKRLQIESFKILAEKCDAR